MQPPAPPPPPPSVPPPPPSVPPPPAMNYSGTNVSCTNASEKLIGGTVIEGLKTSIYVESRKAVNSFLHFNR